MQLTINSDFQRAVNKALANNIDMINRVYNTGDMKAAAGAAVVLDVKDGSVLAAANYPALTRTCTPPTIPSTALTPVCPCSTGRCKACTLPAPPLNLLWQWRRWTAA